MTARRALALAALAAALAAPAAADGDRVAATRLPTCTDGEPFLVYIVDATADDDCTSTGGGTTEAPCLCLDGSYVAMLAAGGGGSTDSFKTQNTPSGTDPVADSSTDTLNWTAGTGITLTGDSTTDTITVASTIPSITLDLGDDGGNDSTALAEIAPINDNGGAFAEPTADKLTIDVAKLRPASADNPLEAAATWACEFDGSICSGSLVGTGTTSNPVSGTIDLLASVTPDPLYSYSFLPGKLCIQSDESTNQVIDLYWSHTPATNATYLLKVDFQNRDLSTTEGTSELGLKTSADANESVWNNIYGAGTGYVPRIYVENNGAFTIVTGSGVGERQLVPTAAWMVLWKVSNTYHAAWMVVDDGLLTPLSSVTKTGVTTFDELHVRFLTANDSPSIVWCVDYVRYYDSLVYEFVNE